MVAGMLEVRPESPSGSLALVRPISRAPFPASGDPQASFCAPRCAYVEYAHSGVPHPTKPTGFAGTPSRRLLGSGPPEAPNLSARFPAAPLGTPMCSAVLARGHTQMALERSGKGGRRFVAGGRRDHKQLVVCVP